MDLLNALSIAHIRRLFQAGVWLRDDYTPVDGQTVFTLSEEPASVYGVFLVVNGVLYHHDADFVVSGTVLTWLDNEFTIAAGDTVHVYYDTGGEEPVPPTPASADTFEAICLATNVVGDAVYAYDNAVGDIYKVRRADPRDTAKMPALGIIVSKETSTECTVQFIGGVTGVYGGMTVNQRLFVSAVGRLADSPPTALPGGYALIQPMGVTVGFNILQLSVGSIMAEIIA